MVNLRDTGLGTCFTFQIANNKGADRWPFVARRGSKIARNSVFDGHLSPVGRQMAIENSVSNDFFLSSYVDSIKIFDCRLPGVKMVPDIFSIHLYMQSWLQSLISPKEQSSTDYSSQQIAALIKVDCFTAISYEFTFSIAAYPV